jgi:hypothetical protein
MRALHYTPYSVNVSLYAGTFTLLACLLSFWHLTLHLRYHFKPDVQRRIMAVLWMVPIYRCRRIMYCH